MVRNAQSDSAGEHDSLRVDSQDNPTAFAHAVVGTESSPSALDQDAHVFEGEEEEEAADISTTNTALPSTRVAVPGKRKKMADKALDSSKADAYKKSVFYKRKASLANKVRPTRFPSCN
jgi:hypothetical protein